VSLKKKILKLETALEERKREVVIRFADPEGQYQPILEDEGKQIVVVRFISEEDTS